MSRKLKEMSDEELKAETTQFLTGKIRDLQELMATKTRLSDKQYLQLCQTVRDNAMIRATIATLAGTTKMEGGGILFWIEAAGRAAREMQLFYNTAAIKVGDKTAPITFSLLPPPGTVWVRKIDTEAESAPEGSLDGIPQA